MVGTQYRIPCLIDNCQKSYLKSTKRSHMLVHKKATFKCSQSQCDMMFKRPIDRKRHEAIHCNVWVRYKCQKCQKRFVRENSLKLHNKKRPNCDKDIANFICSMCQRRYVFKTSLNKHEKLNYPNCGNWHYDVNRQLWKDYIKENNPGPTIARKEIYS